MACDACDGPVNRHTLGVPQAAERLERLAGVEPLMKVYNAPPFRALELLRNDLALVMNEFRGLQQYDPR